MSLETYWGITNADVESYCWHPDGWECAAEGSVRDARKVTRGKAAAFFAREASWGDIRLVRVWKRYVRPWTRQDQWDYSGRERWEYRNEVDESPDHPPADWQPDWESDPVWEFVHRDHPDAIPVWVCGQKGDKPPSSPARETIR